MAGPQTRAFFTTHGYDPLLLISAIQKCVRRGMEFECYYYCLELCMSNKSQFSMCINRLLAIAHEDVGLGDPEAVMFTMQTVSYIREFYDKGKEDWMLMLANVVMALCRAGGQWSEPGKSRSADHLACIVHAELLRTGKLPKIPDAALDCHTRQGRALGRGMLHFFQEGRQVNHYVPCQYEDEYVDLYLNRMNSQKKSQGPYAGRQIEEEPVHRKPSGQAELFDQE